ncbi:hypothetical protein [Microbacterium lacticum]
MSKLVQVARRVTFGAFAAALVVVLAACSAAAPVEVATPAREGTEVQIRSVSGDEYGIRLGETVEGSQPGTANAQVWLPSDGGGGIWFRVTTIEGNSPFPATLCEGAVLFWGEIRMDGSTSCRYSVAYRGDLREGMTLFLNDVPANSLHYEVEVRGLGDGTASQPKMRTVFMIGKLIPSGAAK